MNVFPHFHKFSFAKKKIEYQWSAIQISNPPRLTWDLETRHAILLQISTYLMSESWYKRNIFYWRVNMFLRLPSKDVGDVALQKICSRSTMMNLFLGLALEDGGDSTLQNIAARLSRLDGSTCFWDCLWKMGSWKTGPWDAVGAESRYE